MADATLRLARQRKEAKFFCVCVKSLSDPASDKVVNDGQDHGEYCKSCCSRQGRKEEQSKAMTGKEWQLDSLQRQHCVPRPLVFQTIENPFRNMAACSSNRISHSLQQQSR